MVDASAATRRSNTSARAACAAFESAPVLGGDHLSPEAGVALKAPVAGARHEGATREEVEEVLRQQRGNVAAAARSLKLHRTQLRRLIARFGLEPRHYGDQNEADSEGDER